MRAGIAPQAYTPRLRDNRQFHGNAFALMRRAERFLIESLPIAGRVIPGRMEREDTPLLPVEALREALFREHESGPWNPMIARTFYRRGVVRALDLLINL